MHQASLIVIIPLFTSDSTLQDRNQTPEPKAAEDTTAKPTAYTHPESAQQHMSAPPAPHQHDHYSSLGNPVIEEEQAATPYPFSKEEHRIHLDRV